MAGLYTGDKRISGKLEQASIVSRKKAWRDLDLTLKIHPIRKDIIPLKDDAAIKNAVKNLLVSNFHERPFASDKGANLVGLLFEPVGVMTNILLRNNIKTVLDKYEPRVVTTGITIQYLEGMNAYNILVKFRIKEFDSASSVEVLLRRLR